MGRSHAVRMVGAVLAVVLLPALAPAAQAGTASPDVPAAASSPTPAPAPAPTAPTTPAPTPTPVVSALPLPVPVAVPGVAAPRLPKLTAPVDPYAHSEAEDTCSPTEKPGAAALRALLLASYGGLPGDVNIVRACSAQHTGHAEGRALDWFVNMSDPAQESQAQTFLAWLFAPDAAGNPAAMARRLGVMYIEHAGYMYRSYLKEGTAPFGTLPQYVTVGGVRTPCSAAPGSYVTTCHRDHMHISLSWDGALERTSFFGDGLGGACPVPPQPTAPALPGTEGLPYVSLPAPVRLLDTRAGTGTATGARCRVGPGGRVDVLVTGRAGVPASGVGAVVLNVAGVSPSSATYLTVWPAGVPRPATSSVNLSSGENRASLVAVPVGSDGKVSIANFTGSADVVVDVVGYHPVGAEHLAAAARYYPVVPARLADTRVDGPRQPIAGGRYLEVPVAGRAGVPAAGASSVVVNVTVDSPAADGFLSLTPTVPDAAPATSTLNFTAGRQTANRAYAQLSSAGSLFVWVSTSAPVLVDVVGWFGSGARSSDFVPVRPLRIMDTRADKSSLGGLARFSSRNTQSFPVVNSGAVPPGTRAVLATLTGTRPTARTYVTAWPGGADRPVASDLNLSPGQSVANLVVIPVGADGTIDLYNYSGSLDLVLDLLGYYR